MLYSACNRAAKVSQEWSVLTLLLGRKSLVEVLRHSTFHFPSNSEHIVCWVAELYTALCFDTRKKMWKYQIYHFFEWESNPQLIARYITLNKQFYMRKTNHTVIYSTIENLIRVRTCNARSSPFHSTSPVKGRSLSADAFIIRYI